MESQVKPSSKDVSVDWSTASRYARLVALARTVFYQAGNSQDVPGHQPNPSRDIYKQAAASGDLTVDANFINEYDLLYNIAMTDGIATSGKVSGNQELVYYGFIAKYKVSPYNYVVVIRGTEANAEWSSDLDDQPVPYEELGGNANVVKGFYDLYRSAQLLMPPDVQLNTPKQISLSEAAASPTVVMPDAGKVFTVITGHSLGGALAHLYASATVNTSSGNCGEIQVYSFAAPNVGDANFAIDYDIKVKECYRIHNKRDVVPQSPGNLQDPYYQVAHGIEIDSKDYDEIYYLTDNQDDTNKTVGCAHILPSYLFVMETKAGLKPNKEMLYVNASCDCRSGK